MSEELLEFLNDFKNILHLALDYENDGVWYIQLKEHGKLRTIYRGEHYDIYDAVEKWLKEK